MQISFAIDLESCLQHKAVAVKSKQYFILLNRCGYGMDQWSLFFV